LPEKKRRYGAGCDPADGFPAGRAAAASVISESVFLLKSVVCVSGTIGECNLSVIPGTLILISDNHGNGRTCCLPLEYSRTDFTSVRFLPFCRILALPGPAPVEKCLNVILCKGNPGRASVDHCTYGRTVGLPPCSDTEYFAK